MAKKRKQFTTAEHAKRRIRQSYQPNYYRRQYELMLQAFGVTSNYLTAAVQGGADEYGDGLMVFPEINPMWTESGSSDLIRAASMTAMARLFGKDPEPQFLGVSKFAGEIRKQYFLKSYDGYGERVAGFGQASKDAFLDLDNLGMGCVQFGLVENRRSKEMQSAGKHIPRLQWVYDRFVRSPIESSWWAGWDYIEVEVAEALYGYEAVKNARQTERWRDANDYYDVGEYVRVLQYFDVGFGNSEPTMITWVGSLENDPVEGPAYNEYETIPCAFGVGFTAPGKRYADGRIYNQLASQDARRVVLDHIKETLAYHAVDVFDESMMESEDWEDLVAGGRRIRGSLTDLNGKQPWIRIPAMEVASTTLEYFRMVMEEYNAQSGLSELDRGSIVSKSRSATEMAILDAKTKMNQAMSVGQTMLYQRRLAISHEAVGKLGDYHPRILNIRGGNLPINVKGEPESWIGHWLGEEAEILISQESMTADEDEIKRMATTEKLVRLAPYAQSGYVDFDWWLGELIEASGFDIDQALAKRSPVAAVNQAASAAFSGMPGGGVAGAPSPSQAMPGAALQSA